jgi:enoyl-CoA hydratase/carnithine racemase
MRQAVTQSYDEIFAEEAKIQQSIFSNEENLEGVTAFFEKREPNFK